MKQSLAWHIGPDVKPTRLHPGAVDLQEHLEDWLTDDIAIVANDILVISTPGHRLADIRITSPLVRVPACKRI